MALVNAVMPAALRCRAPRPWGNSDVSTDGARCRPAARTTPSSRMTNAPSRRPSGLRQQFPFAAVYHSPSSCRGLSVRYVQRIPLELVHKAVHIACVAGVKKISAVILDDCLAHQGVALCVIQRPSAEMTVPRFFGQQMAAFRTPILVPSNFPSHFLTLFSLGRAEKPAL